MRPVFVGFVKIRPGSQRRAAAGRLTDWNVQQSGKSAVGDGQRDRQLIPGGVHPVNLPQTAAVTRGLSGPFQRCPRLHGGQRGPVRKTDARTQYKRVRCKIVVVRVTLAEAVLRLQTGVQTEQALIDQGRDYLLHSVRTGDRVQRVIWFKGESKAVRQMGRGVLFRLRRRLDGDRAFQFRRLRVLLLPAGAEKDRQA